MTEINYYSSGHVNDTRIEVSDKCHSCRTVSYLQKQDRKEKKTYYLFTYCLRTDSGGRLQTDLQSCFFLVKL